MKILVLAALTLLSAYPAPHQEVITARRRVVSAGGCTLPFTDSFIRANGALGANWQTTTGSAWAISSNAATPGSFSGFVAAWVPCAGYTSSEYARATVTGITDPQGLTLYTSDQNNFYYLQCQNGSCSVFSRVAGSNTFISSYGSGPASGDTVCFEVDSGTTLKLKVNTTYDTFSFPTGGVLAVVGAGGMWASSGASPTAFTNFSTGNGTCP